MVDSSYYIIFTIFHKFGNCHNVEETCKMKYVDGQIFVCPSCRQLWIIVSNKQFTVRQYLRWLAECIMEHAKMKRERNNNDKTNN